MVDEETDEYDNRVKTALNNGRTARLAVEGEYATLECQLSTADAVQCVPTTIHLQVVFNNNSTDDLDKTVLNVNAVVVAADPNISGGYRGSESGHHAVAIANSRSTVISTVQAVSDWSKNAYLALIRDSDGNNVMTSEHPNSNNNVVASEYEYYLKQIKLRDGLHTLLEFGWRIKLRPFGTMVLGSVLLLKMNPSEFVNHVSTWFIKPLISNQLAERKHRNEAERVASADIKKLSEDNKGLLETLQLFNKSKEQEDRRKMVQFMEVLNAKKQKLIAVTRELSELKQQQSHSMPAAIETEKEGSKSVMNQQLTRSKRNKTMMVANNKKRPKTQYKNCTISSEEDKQKDIQVDGNIFFTNTITEDLNLNESPPWFQDQLPTEEKKQIHNIDTIKQEMELMEVVNECNVNSSTRDVSGTTEVSSTVINVPVVDSIFTADTQVDDDNTKSPSLLQQESPIKPMTKMESMLLLPSSSNKDVHEENKKMTAFDHLWSGIA